MRDLTEEELKLAPDWATHYTKAGSQVTFFNELKVQSSLDGELDDIVYDNNYGIESSDVQIPSKHFDITKHEFSDTGIECCEVGGGVLTIHNPELTTNLLFDDAIAIAKALGVTREDLN